MEEAPFFADVAGAPDGTAAQWLRTRDGLRIRMAAFAGGPKGTILIFPGRTEWIEKYGNAMSEFAARGFSSVTVDWRGQGLAERLDKDPLLGEVGKFADYQIDVATVLAAIESQDLPKPWILVGHSMGGAIGLRALIEGLPVKAASFSAPMWGIYISPIMRPFANLMAMFCRPLGYRRALPPGTERNNYVFTNGFDGNTLTNDPEMFALMQRHLSTHPELEVGGPSFHWLHEGLKECRYLAKASLPPIPSLCTLGGSELIVDPPSVRRLCARWDSCTFIDVPGAQHEIMMEIPEIRSAFFDRTVALAD